jgi:hypothetical protein
MAFSFVLTDRQGNQLGELRNASNRSLRFPLNRTPTVSFQIDATHPFAPWFLDVDKVLLKAYDDSTGSRVLRFYGPVVGYEKTRNAQGGTMTVTAAGVQWRLDHRLIGKADATLAGATFGTTSLSLLDRGEIMGRTIDALNTGESTNIFTFPADTGIRRGTITASSSTYVGPWRYKLAGEVCAELSGTLDGPDWEVTPTEPVNDGIGVLAGGVTVGAGVQIGVLNVAAAIGAVQPNVAFEFGTGQHNVAEWKDIGDSNTLANITINLPPGFPDNATQAIIASSDTVAMTDRGVYEAVVAADLATDDLRTKLVQEHVRIRKVPRRIIQFSPIAENSAAAAQDRRVPRLFADYIVGDTVRFRAVERFPVFDTAGTVVSTASIPTVDLLMRVFVAQIDLDDNGTASTSLTLQQDGS